MVGLACARDSASEAESRVTSMPFTALINLSISELAVSCFEQA